MFQSEINLYYVIMVSATEQAIQGHDLRATHLTIFYSSVLLQEN